MREQTFFKPLLASVSGLVIWAAHFGIIYAVNALNCERRWMDQTVLGMGLVPFAITMATIAAVLGLAIIAALAFLDKAPNLPDAANERTSVFFRKLTITVTALALVAVIYQTIPVYVVPACA
ncbi:MAG TPA: hypothetical protein VGN60_11335 [Devosia sp.]|jgi:fatty acid desaturase|nr:hypothetical protein [Devosia sp.]